MQRHQGQHNHCFEGHPKRSHRQGHLSSWATAASTPLGDLLLHDEHCIASGARTALPANGGIGVLGDAAFGSFAERLDMTRQRLAHLFADAEKVAVQPKIDKQQAVALLTAIQRAASELRAARESELGWQDIHTDDLALSVRCRRSCALLLAALEKHTDSARPVSRVVPG